MKIAVVGAGVAGSAIALDALSRGWTPTVFDGGGTAGCSMTAAGMLTPYSELETAGRELFEFGQRSIERWPSLLALLDHPVFFRREGSLLAAHPSDRPQLRRLLDLIERKVGERLAPLAEGELQALESDVAVRGDVVYLERDGQIDSQAFIRAASTLFEERGILRRQRVSSIAANRILVGDAGSEQFDWVFDCRGLAAQPDMQELRGVRGELIWINAPGVSISRPVRLLHPRYRVYVVPRPDHVYLVGASEIESEDRGAITVRSTLELLSALFSIQPAFAEARIIRTDVNLRPAFPDNRPRVEHQRGLTRINGLFRHGYLLAPALAEDALDAVAAETGVVAPAMERVYAAD